jgi:basic membrane protein A
MTTNPDAIFLTTFSGDQDDADVNQAVAEAQIAEGADIIFTMLNAGRIGAIDASREAGISQIGNVRDWYEVHPDVFVASAIANVSMAGLQAAQDVADGSWEPGVIVTIGIENPNAVWLALSPDIPEDVLSELESLTEKLASGEIDYAAEYEGEEFELGS